MALVDIEIKGLKQLGKAMNSGARAIDKGFGVWVKKTTALILGTSRTRTPVDTGFLRGPAMKTTLSGKKGIIKNVAPYALFVHEGTKFMRARPFFDQGIAQARTQLKRLLGDTIDISLRVIKNT